MWLDTGWSYLEHPDRSGREPETLRWRWMSEHARLGVVSAASTRMGLRMTAQAFGQPRRLQIQIAGSTVATRVIQTTRAEFETPEFAIPAGASFLELTSLDGAAPAGADPRRLSIAIYDVALLSQSRR
jgi:hypothetical protein